MQPNAPGTQGYNLYAYTANNPTTWVDPSGDSAVGAALGVAVLRTGGASHTTTYALTSLPATAVPLATVEAVWRGHWGIENRVHHVRDVSFREDAGQAHSGHIVQALAALRNGLLSCLRAAGLTRIADALRHYAAHLDETLALIGAIS